MKRWLGVWAWRLETWCPCSGPRPVAFLGRPITWLIHTAMCWY